MRELLKSISLEELLDALRSGRERRLRLVEGAITVSGGRIRCTLPGRQNRPLLTITPPGRFKLARPPYSIAEQRLMHKVLKLFDRDAKIVPVTRDGWRVRLRLLGEQRPVRSEDSHMVIIPAAETPPHWAWETAGEETPALSGATPLEDLF